MYFVVVAKLVCLINAIATLVFIRIGRNFRAEVIAQILRRQVNPALEAFLTSFQRASKLFKGFGTRKFKKVS
jgi:hypothetical protein